MEQNVESFPSRDRSTRSAARMVMYAALALGKGLTLDDFELLRRDLHGLSLVDVQVRL